MTVMSKSQRYRAALVEEQSALALIEDAGIGWPWPTDPDHGGPKVAYLKRWTWWDGPERCVGWSLRETLDYAGFVQFEAMTGHRSRRLKLRDHRLGVVIEDVRCSSAEQLPIELTEPLTVSVPGVGYNWIEALGRYGYVRSDVEHRVELGRQPMSWLREALTRDLPVGTVPLELSGALCMRPGVRV